MVLITLATLSLPFFVYWRLMRIHHKLDEIKVTWARHDFEVMESMVQLALGPGNVIVEAEEADMLREWLYEEPLSDFIWAPVFPDYDQPSHPPRTRTRRVWVDPSMHGPGSRPPPRR